MAYSARSYARNYGSFGGSLPPAVKWLLIVNVLIFVVQYFSHGTRLDEFFTYFALYPAAVVKLLFVWQLVTYMFLHGGIWHIVFNMLALWMFGVQIENAWGTRKFLRFYFFCGIGAGIIVVIANYLFGDPRVPTIGSSGAIYGLLMVSALLWPDQVIFFNFLFPIKMKYFVMIIGAIAFLGTFNSQSGVSDVAHLSGLGFGYLYLKMPDVKGFEPGAMIRGQYKSWRLARAKKKFQVYLRKQGSDRGPYVH